MPKGCSALVDTTRTAAGDVRYWQILLQKSVADFFGQ
jgi:hypothetical protein